MISFHSRESTAVNNKNNQYTLVMVPTFIFQLLDKCVIYKYQSHVHVNPSNYHEISIGTTKEL